MIKVLERKLQEAQAERARVVAPYDTRIKKMKASISNLKEFDAISNQINTAEMEDVCGVPSMDEAVTIHELDKK